MSAFFCGRDHINAMLSWLDAVYRGRVPYPKWYGGNEVRIEPSRDQWTEIGKALMSENIASLRYRYPNDWQELVDVDLNRYLYQHDPLVPLRKNSALLMLKMIKCYEYQSCEHPEWPSSWACSQFCRFAKDAAISHLDGWEDCDGWEYRRPVDAPVMIRVSDLVKRKR